MIAHHIPTLITLLTQMTEISDLEVLNYQSSDPER